MNSEDHELALTINALVISVHATSNRDLFAAIAASGLTVSELRLLERLRSGAVRPTIKQAARIAQCDASHMSKVADKLTQQGYVTREEDDDDCRIRRLQITDKGRQVLIGLHALRLENITAWTERLDRQDVKQLAAAIRQTLNLPAGAAGRQLERTDLAAVAA